MKLRAYVLRILAVVVPLTVLLGLLKGRQPAWVYAIHPFLYWPLLGTIIVLTTTYLVSARGNDDENAFVVWCSLLLAVFLAIYYFVVSAGMVQPGSIVGLVAVVALLGVMLLMWGLFWGVNMWR